MATIRWCPIYPKWDSYQPLIGSYYCGDIPVWFHYDRHKFTWVCLKIGYPKLHSLSSHSLFKWPFMGIQYPPFLDPDTLRYWFIVWSLLVAYRRKDFSGEIQIRASGESNDWSQQFQDILDTTLVSKLIGFLLRVSETKDGRSAAHSAPKCW